MLVATALTAVYYRLLYRAFNRLLYFTPTSAGSELVKSPSSCSFFYYKALRLSIVISLLSDEQGISSTEACQIRQELLGIAVLENRATICLSGKIRLTTNAI
jgi:hypothetical protein